jgi:DNA-binding transcriptional LysR family regulator/DNA-binding CsgD family transcriptional regulator
MDLEYLREYLSIADELNLTAAARHLSTTQSTLSKHLAALEREMGAQLINRTSHGIELTRAGATLYNRARMVVDLYDGTRDEVRRCAEQRTVRVGGLLQNGEVMNLLTRTSALAGTRTDAAFALAPTQAAIVPESLEHDGVDVLLCHRSHALDDAPLLGGEVLLKSQFLAIVEETSPLAARTGVSLAELAPYPFVQLVGNYGAAGWEAIEAACRRHGFEPQRFAMIADNAVDYLSYPLGDAVLIAQRSLLPLGMSPRPGTCTIPVTDDDANFELTAYFRRDDVARLAPFMGVVRQAAEQVRAAIDESARGGASTRPFQRRCRSLAGRCGLNATETEAMISYAKGRSIDRIAEDLHLSRVMVGDLLAGVYQKLGIRDKQELLDAVEAEKLG